MTPTYADEALTLYTADCLEVMPTLPDASVDAVVTDPPYGLEFMGKEWDRLLSKRPTHDAKVAEHKENGRHGGGSNPFVQARVEKYIAGPTMQTWHTEWAREAFRLLKPGGHLLAFGGTRTYHRLASAIEDAGFEIRDCLVWAYASGFPKSLDVGKAIDRARDDSAAKWAVADFLRPHVERVGFDAVSRHFGFLDETMARARWTSHSQTNTPTWDQWRALKALLSFGDEMDAEVWRLNGRKGTPGDAWDQREKVGTDRSGPAIIAFARDGSTEFDLTAPATDDAKRWDGWGTALKPAWEPIVFARRPLQGTVAANVLRYGVGALNIDGTRIGTTREVPASHSTTAPTIGAVGFADRRVPSELNPNIGRWPANVVLTDPIFDGDTPGVVGGGETSSGLMRSDHQRHTVGGNGLTHGAMSGEASDTYGDTGTYSRFFLIPKEARAGREPAVRGQLDRSAAQKYGSIQDGRSSSGEDYDRTSGRRENSHPTVKPLELMRHLVRLVTPPGGTVLDCFLGSGTTALAAINEGFRCIGIEREAEYMAITMARLPGTQTGIGL